jgi:hypothetical protein
MSAFSTSALHKPGAAEKKEELNLKMTKLPCTRLLNSDEKYSRYLSHGIKNTFLLLLNEHETDEFEFFMSSFFS